METLNISKSKKLLKINLSELSFIDYVKETIISVLNNP
jgi:hypothetical protein